MRPTSRRAGVRERGVSNRVAKKTGSGAVRSRARAIAPRARRQAFGVDAKEIAGKRPATIAEYVRAAPRAGRPHLRRLYAILKSVAPEAEETIKWGTPFFVEPRFLFAFSAHKAHLDFAPTPAALARFRPELARHKTTRYFIQIPYDEPLPASLLRKIAEYRLRELRKRKSDSFW